MNRAIWLYGSQARGDADSESDIDVLIVADEHVPQADIAHLIPTGRTPSLSRYRWSEIKGMAAYGSLFLHHLKLKGRALYEDGQCQGQLANILDHLPQYQRALLDVRAFKMTVQDVRRSINHGGSPLFEASVLGTVLRHSAILGCYVSGFPTFGRIKPVLRIVEAWGLSPVIASKFSELYRLRTPPDGHLNQPPRITVADVNWWCDCINRALKALEEHVYAYERGLQTGVGLCR